MSLRDAWASKLAAVRSSGMAWLADGRRIGLASHSRGDGREAAFLREVRNRACESISTVLLPDYNRALRDYLHLDQTARAGWSFCR